MRHLIICCLAIVPSYAASAGWTALPNTKLQSVCPQGVPGSCGAVITAWSGAAADTLRNRLIIWGGGHNDYYGNEVYALNLNANPVTLTRLNNPSPPNTLSTQQTTLSDGNPNSRHTYNGLTYLSASDRMLAFGGVPAGPAGGFVSDLWTLDLASLAWKAMDPVNGASGKQPKSFYNSVPPIAIYDPNKNLTFIMDSASGILWTYDYPSNTYTYITNNAPVPFNSTPVLDTKRHLIYFFGSGAGSPGDATTAHGPSGVYTLDISGTNYTLQNITSKTSGCDGIAGAYNPGVAYDSALDRIVGWPNFGDTVYLFDPSTNTCTTQTFAGGPPNSTDYNGAAYTTGTYGRFQYFPSLDAFAVVNFATNNAYMLRLTSSTGNPPPASLPTISSFTTASLSLASGSATTLTWSTTGASAVSISPGLGSVALSGSASVSPSANTTYTLTATNSAGSVTATVTVSVSTPVTVVTPVISSFSPSASTTTAGQAVTLSWSASGATSIAITPGTFTSTSNSGSTSVSPTSTTVYTLTATNSAGATTAQTTITIGSQSSTPPPSTVSNTLTITNAGSSATNYPVQFGRPFVQGEVPSGQLPQVKLGSTAVSTQVDVKNRWPDGSLKYAIISFIIPSFGAGQAYTVTLSPGTTVGNTALTQAQMLASNFNFDARMELTGSGTTKAASARAMLTNGDYTVWASGPIATTIILANHAQTATCGGKASSTYDFGFDSFCAVRPEFIATFWPATNQVFVRYIGEIGANSEQAEDVTVSGIVLKLGNNSPTTVYTLPSAKSPLTMWAYSRWTKTFWLNGTPPAASYNHNMPYLISTYAVPNFDTSKVMSSTTLSSVYSTWTKLDNADPYSPSDLTLNAPAPGGRNYPADEIGPYTGPETWWLYTGDSRMQEMSIRYAELAAAWPVHYREGKSGKFIDRAHTISGVGHWLSVSSRPTYWCCDTTNTNIAAADRIVPVGTVGANPWHADTAHQPSWYPTYLLTGDYFFLEEIWAWASFSQNSNSVGYRVNDPIGRGPTGVEGNIPGDYGGIFSQTRSQAWVFAHRAEAAYVSPDGSPEQGYYDLLTKDAIAAWEAIHEISNSSFKGTAEWNWAHRWGNADTSNGCWIWCNYIPGGQVPTAIPFWVPGNNGQNGYPESSSYNGLSQSPWMVNWLIYALGRAKELGYPTQYLLSWIAPWAIQPVVDPTFNPYLIASYRQPTKNMATGNWYTTWSQMLNDMCSSTATGCNNFGASTNAKTAPTFDPPVNNVGMGCSLNPNGDGTCSSAYIAGIAIAAVADQPNGSAAWNWINTNAMTNSALNTNPKWAIIPRSATSTTPPPVTPSANSCDLNSDGQVNAADVQIAIGQALGTSACGSADLLQNGQCNVVDVQRVINASMGGACVLGGH